MGPATATVATKSVAPSWRVTGVSASSGKLSMASTSVLTSPRKRSMEAPSRIWMTAMARLSRASQRVSRKASTPSTASSMRWQMAFSTSSAVAPG